MLVAAYRQPETSLSESTATSAPLWFAAQALRDPGNIGTILRTGDAVGAGGLILHRRQRRSLLRRGRARLDGRDLHAEGREGALGRIRRAGCAAGEGQLVGTSLKPTRTIWTSNIGRRAFC